jgi:hypothetical protein
VGATSSAAADLFTCNGDLPVSFLVAGTRVRTVPTII